MGFMDYISIIGAAASVVSLIASMLNRLSAYREALLRFGAFFLGLFIARLLDTLVPPRGPGFPVTSPQLAWAVILALGVTIGVRTLFKEGAGSAMIVFLVIAALFSLVLLFAYVQIPSQYSFEEQMQIVDTREKAGNFDGAIELLHNVEANVEPGEQEAFKKRISTIRAEKFGHVLPPPTTETRH